jgi:hypothetical protein
VTIRRELAATQPAVFSHRLATSLRVMAARLSELRREAEAEAASQEAKRFSRSGEHRNAADL